MNAVTSLTEDEIHELKIEEERLAMTRCYAAGDRAQAARHERVMAALIDLRSDGQKARMRAAVEARIFGATK